MVIKKIAMCILFLLSTIGLSCSRPAPNQPVNHVANFNRAATPAEKARCLAEIVDLDPVEASEVLKQIDAANSLLAVDDQLNCIFHDNSDGTTRRASPNKIGGSRKSADRMQLDEVRWLGWSDGDVFGFPQQRYSIFVGKKAQVDEYAIFFLVFEKGRGSGLNAGELREDHYEVLSDLQLWPDDW